MLFPGRYQNYRRHNDQHTGYLHPGKGHRKEQQGQYQGRQRLHSPQNSRLPRGNLCHTHEKQQKGNYRTE